MKIISGEINGESESYLCQPGQTIRSFRAKKIYLWECECNDYTVQKVNPNTTWDEYYSNELINAFQGESVIIKIQKKHNCACDICKNCK